MGRTIVLPKMVAPTERLNLPQNGQANVPDKYLSQIVKLIPVDIVGVYLGIQGLFSPLSETNRFYFQITSFLILLIISPFYLRKVAEIIDNKQIMIAVLSYIIWGISLGGPFEHMMKQFSSEISAQQIGGALVMIYTLIVPILYGKKIKNGI